MAQQLIAGLAFVREGGHWKLRPILPAPPGASDAARAARDGESAGRWFRAMVKDGSFTAGEQADIGAVLGGCYCVSVEHETPRPPAQVWVAPATPDGVKRLATLVPSLLPHGKPPVVIFWPEPSAETLAEAQRLANEAVQGVYNDLAAVKDQYPELREFDREHLYLEDGSLRYPPTTEKRTRSTPTPMIWFGVGEPLS